MANCLQQVRLKMNERIGQKILLSFTVSLIILQRTKSNGGESLQIEPMWFESGIV